MKTYLILVSILVVTTASAIESKVGKQSSVKAESSQKSERAPAFAGTDDDFRLLPQKFVDQENGVVCYYMSRENERSTHHNGYAAAAISCVKVDNPK